MIDPAKQEFALAVVLVADVRITANLGYRVLENEGTLIHRLELERAIGPILPSGVAPMTICASFAAHAYPRIHRKIKDRLSDHLASDSIP